MVYRWNAEITGWLRVFGMVLLRTVIFTKANTFSEADVESMETRSILLQRRLPIDRLMFCQYRNDYIVSNSLILLLAYTGAHLDPAHDYHKESLSICKGLAAYEKEYTIIHPEIDCFYQVFIENTIISKEGLSFQRRDRNEPIESYDQYYDKITSILKKIKHNYESRERKIDVSAFSTISTGYDSVAVSSLVKELGVNKLFTGNQLNAPFQLVNGTSERKRAAKIAKKLGYDVIYLDNRRSRVSEDELYFLATNYPKHYTNAWSEIGLYSMAKYIEKHCSAGVVFNGHHGDSVWDVNIQEKYLNRNLMKPRTMGFCGEMRLKSGFIMIPVPGLLSTQIKDIVKISRSPEMSYWRLNNDYDRPIPRRIAETAGVKRHQFGMKKKYIALDKYLWPINAILRRHFFGYVKEKYGINRITVYMEYIIQKLYRTLLHRYVFSKLCGRKRYANFLLKKI